MRWRVLAVVLTFFVCRGFSSIATAQTIVELRTVVEIRNEQQLPQNDDLLAQVKGENGEPMPGVHAQLLIKQTVGFFTGTGPLRVFSRTASDENGELRFSSGANWKGMIDAEVQARKAETGIATKDFEAFRDYKWTLRGYWPQTNSRIELVSTGTPPLWKDDEKVSIVMPALQQVRILIKSESDEKPIANVRTWIRREHGSLNDQGGWNTVNAYAWTDATGSAVVWLPKGDYRVMWDPTLAVTGFAAKSELFSIDECKFGEMPHEKQIANRSTSFHFIQDQLPLTVGNVAPEIYELSIEPPLPIIP